MLPLNYCVSALLFHFQTVAYSHTFFVVSSMLKCASLLKTKAKAKKNHTRFDVRAAQLTAVVNEMRKCDFIFPFLDFCFLISFNATLHFITL
jgi:hypothetical protein